MLSSSQKRYPRRNVRIRANPKWIARLNPKPNALESSQDYNDTLGVSSIGVVAKVIVNASEVARQTLDRVAEVANMA